MLDKLFTFATWHVALGSLIILGVGFALMAAYNPKHAIAKSLSQDYVDNDFPIQSEGFHWYGYDTARVVNMLRKYDRDPDRFYGLHELFILRHDLLFPVCYGLTLFFMLAYLQQRVGGVPRWVVLALPLASVAFDYAENFTMLAFLRAFRRDQQTPLTLLELSRVLTITKWTAVLLLVIVLFTLFAAFVVSLFRESPAAP